jgi:cytochrome c oxidase subunit 1
MLLLTLSILSSVLFLVLADLHSNTLFFDTIFGGDPIFYQHLFWFFAHPEVYILIIPAFGIISIIISSISQKIIFGNLLMIFAMSSISLLGSLVWGHHMYTIGLESDTRIYFTAVTILISLPTGTKIFNWLTTYLYIISLSFLFPLIKAFLNQLYILHPVHNNFSFNPQPLHPVHVFYLLLISISSFIRIIFIISSFFFFLFFESLEMSILSSYFSYIFLFMFTIGGSTGIILGNAAVDHGLHDTYYVVAHFHFVLSLGAVIAIFSGIIFFVSFFSSFFLYTPSFIFFYSSINLLYLSLTFIGILLSFSPMHFLGFNLMPRRIPDFPDSFHSWNYLSSIGSGITFLSFTIFSY